MDTDATFHCANLAVPHTQKCKRNTTNKTKLQAFTVSGVFSWIEGRVDCQPVMFDCLFTFNGITLHMLHLNVHARKLF